MIQDHGGVTHRLYVLFMTDWTEEDSVYSLFCVFIEEPSAVIEAFMNIYTISEGRSGKQETVTEKCHMQRTVQGNRSSSESLC